MTEPHGTKQGPVRRYWVSLMWKNLTGLYEHAPLCYENRYLVRNQILEAVTGRASSIMTSEWKVGEVLVNVIEALPKPLSI